jgi:hypothetical protein
MHLGAARDMSAVQEDFYHLAGLAGTVGAFQPPVPTASV